MVNDKRLIVGAFYWVIPKSAWNAAGEMLWNFMGFDGSSNWPVLWVGETIEVPIMPAQAQRNWFSAAITSD